MCAICGIYGHPDAAAMTQLGVWSMQHRGPESHGIAASDGARINRIVGCGEISDFDRSNLARLPGSIAIGHARYGTAGGRAELKNAQPIHIDCRQGQMAIVHNGNLTNAESMRGHLRSQGAIFSTDSDTEIIPLLYARARAENPQGALREVLPQLCGAYSLIIMTEKTMIGVRDPHGFRPLCLGRLPNDGVVMASETIALDKLGAKSIGDVAPGEMVIVSNIGIQRIQFAPRAAKLEQCIFEQVYFANPASNVFEENVYRVRDMLGRTLARESPVAADVVVPVPDSGVIAALGFAQESGTPFGMGLMRNHYVGRTFIFPEAAARLERVRAKLSPVDCVIKGKRVVLVDDSIVRGTTSRRIVSMVREAGATEVHLRISSPPTISPCYFGIDTPDKHDLIAAQCSSIEEIKNFLEADSLAYISREGLLGAVNPQTAGNYCTSCFTGNYPAGLAPKR